MIRKGQASGSASAPASVCSIALFSVCSLRQAKFPIIYPDLRLDCKVATHPCESSLLHLSKRFSRAFDPIPDIAAYAEARFAVPPSPYQSLGRASISIIALRFSSFRALRTNPGA
jgi:hypothetical protein